MNCPACGNRNFFSAATCASCGAPLAKRTPPEAKPPVSAGRRKFNGGDVGVAVIALAMLATGVVVVIGNAADIEGIPFVVAGLAFIVLIFMYHRNAAPASAESVNTGDGGQMIGSSGPPPLRNIKLPAVKKGYARYYFEAAAAISRLSIKPQNERRFVLVKVESYYEVQRVCWFLIDPEGSFSTPIPPGLYRIKIGYGTKWLGEDDWFGYEGEYSTVIDGISIHPGQDFAAQLNGHPDKSLREQGINFKEF